MLCECIQVAANTVASAITSVDDSLASLETGEIPVLDQVGKDLFEPTDLGGDVSPTTQAIEAKFPKFGHEFDAISGVQTAGCTPLQIPIPDVDGQKFVPVTFDYCNGPLHQLSRPFSLVWLIAYYVQALIDLVTWAFVRVK